MHIAQYNKVRRRVFSTEIVLVLMAVSPISLDASDKFSRVSICRESMQFLSESSSSLESLRNSFDPEKIEVHYRSVVKNLSLPALIYLADPANTSDSVESIFNLPLQFNEPSVTAELRSIYDIVPHKLKDNFGLLKNLRSSLMRLIRIKFFIQQQSGYGLSHLVELDPVARRFTVSPDARKMAYLSGSVSSKLHLVDLATKTSEVGFESPDAVKRIVKAQELHPTTDVGWFLSDTVFSPNSKLLAGWGSSEDFFAIWDADSKKLVAETDIRLLDSLSSIDHGQIVDARWLSNSELAVVYVDLHPVENTPKFEFIKQPVGLYKKVKTSPGSPLGFIIYLKLKNKKLSVFSKMEPILFYGKAISKYQAMAISPDRSILGVLMKSRKSHLDKKWESEIGLFKDQKLMAEFNSKGEGVYLEYIGPNLFAFVSHQAIEILRLKGTTINVLKKYSIDKYEKSDNLDRFKSAAVSSDLQYLVVGTEQGRRAMLDLKNFIFTWASDGDLPAFQKHMDISESSRAGIHSISITSEGKVFSGSFADGIIMKDQLESFGKITSSGSVQSNNQNIMLESAPLVSAAELQRTLDNGIATDKELEAALKLFSKISPSIEDLINTANEAGVSIGLGEENRTYFLSWKDFFNFNSLNAKGFTIIPSAKTNLFFLFHELRHSVRTKGQAKYLEKKIGSFESEDFRYISGPMKADLRERIKLFVIIQEAFAYEFMINISNLLEKKGVIVKDRDHIPADLKTVYLKNGLDGLLEKIPTHAENFDEYLKSVYKGFEEAFGVDLGDED